MSEASASVPEVVATTASVRIATTDCAAEESEIRRALESVAGVRALSFQLGARALTITAPQRAVDEALTAIRRAGFDPQPLPPTSQEQPAATRHAHDMQGMTGGLVRLAIAAEEVAWFGGEQSVASAIEMALAAAAIWLAGLDTYKAAGAGESENLTAVITCA